VSTGNYAAESALTPIAAGASVPDHLRTDNANQGSQP
jgi:hypothetical protein